MFEYDLAYVAKQQFEERLREAEEARRFRIPKRPGRLLLVRKTLVSLLTRF